MKRWLKHLAVGGLFGALALGAAEERAQAVIVERVVAVIGDRPVLLSELRKRARPMLERILAQAPSAAQAAAAESEMYREILDRMIDERLEEQAADKAHISVTSEDIDRGMKNVATSAHITMNDLIAAARQQGMTEQEYRDELRRQILEGKLVELRVRGRVRVTDQDARNAYNHSLTQLGSTLPVNLEILAMRLPEGATQAQATQLHQVATRLVGDARKGTEKDFCELVKKFSSQSNPQKPCGESGLQAQSALLPPIQAAIAGLQVGEISEPVDVPGQAVLVVRVKEMRAPSFDEVKDQMWGLAYNEVMERQRKLWLSELRHGVYLDVRM